MCMRKSKQTATMVAKGWEIFFPEKLGKSGLFGTNSQSFVVIK